MAKVKVTQVKSSIDRPTKQKDTLKFLVLRKMNASVEIEATPQAMGMIRVVQHLVEVKEL